MGNLEGCNGGLGFDGPWSAAVESKIASGSLPHGTLPTIGNSIGGLGGNMNRFGGTRQISPDALAKRGLLADGVTLWFSAILGYDENATQVNTHLMVALANQRFCRVPAKFYIDDVGSQRGSGLGMCFGSYTTRITPAQFRDLSQGKDRQAWIIVPEQPPPELFSKQKRFRLAIIKFTWGATRDQIDLYAPEEDLLLPSKPYESLSVTVDQSTFDTLTWTRADRVVLDEIRFGPTYESVGGKNAP